MSYSNKSLLIYLFALAEFFSALSHKRQWYQSSLQPPWNDINWFQFVLLCNVLSLDALMSQMLFPLIKRFLPSPFIYLCQFNLIGQSISYCLRGTKAHFLKGALYLSNLPFCLFLGKLGFTMLNKFLLCTIAEQVPPL